jgi:hypothetical protein
MLRGRSRSARSKKALLFEKRSKNFGFLAGRLNRTHALPKQKFFGSFLQKRTLPGRFDRRCVGAAE